MKISVIIATYNRSESLRQALQNKDITVYGDGNQTRSFCYVTDMINGMIKMMNSPDDYIGPVNLGNPYEIPILHLAEEIIRLTNSKSRIVHNKLPQDDPVRRKPDITMARKDLVWKPSVPLEDGLKETIEYFKKTLQNGY